MFRPFYSAPAKLRPDFPLLPGAVRLPPPHVLTGGTSREPPPPGAGPAGQPPAAQSPFFHSDKPWMTSQVLAEIRRRNHLQRVAASCGSEEHLAAAESARQSVNRLVNDAKERFCLAHPERTDEILQTDRLRRPHHCAACDRSYTTPQQLEQHCQQHVRCGLEDCPFTAHPLIVEKHVTMQHQTGLAKVIMSLNTPEAIAKWRQQRKARFCRPETAALRQKEQAEKLARGIRMGSGRGRFPPSEERTGRGGFFRRGGRGRGGRGRAGAHWPARGGRGGVRPAVMELDSDSDEEPGAGMKPFAGILSVGDESDSDSEEGGSAVEPVVTGDEPPDSDHTPHGAPVTPAGQETAGRTGSQLPDVGDVHERTLPDSEEKDNPTAGIDKASSLGENGSGGADIMPQCETLSLEQNVKNNITSSPKQTVSNTCSDPENVISGTPTVSDHDTTRPANSSTSPDVASSDVHTAAAPSRNDGERGGRRGRHQRRGRGRGRGGAADRSADGEHPQQPPRKRRRRLTLLEKLLAPEIERERNIILQCVRYIRRNQFFDGLPIRPGAAPTAAAQAEAAASEPGAEKVGIGAAESSADDHVSHVSETTNCVAKHTGEVSAGRVNGASTESVEGESIESVEGAGTESVKSGTTESVKGGTASVKGSATESVSSDDTQQSGRAVPDCAQKASDKAQTEPETDSGSVQLAGALGLLGTAYNSDEHTDSE